MKREEVGGPVRACLCSCAVAPWPPPPPPPLGKPATCPLHARASCSPSPACLQRDGDRKRGSRDRSGGERRRSRERGGGEPRRERRRSRSRSRDRRRRCVDLLQPLLFEPISPEVKYAKSFPPLSIAPPSPYRAGRRRLLVSGSGGPGAAAASASPSAGAPRESASLAAASALPACSLTRQPFSTIQPHHPLALNSRRPHPPAPVLFPATAPASAAPGAPPRRPRCVPSASGSASWRAWTATPAPSLPTTSRSRLATRKSSSSLSGRVSLPTPGCCFCARLLPCAIAAAFLCCVLPAPAQPRRSRALPCWES